MLHFGSRCSVIVAAQHVWYDRFEKESIILDEEPEEELVETWQRFLSKVSSTFAGAVLLGEEQNSEGLSTSNQIPLQHLNSITLREDYPDDPLHRVLHTISPPPSAHAGTSATAIPQAPSHAGPSTRAGHKSLESNLEQHFNRDEPFTHQVDEVIVPVQRLKQADADKVVVQTFQGSEENESRQKVSHHHSRRGSQDCSSGPHHQGNWPALSDCNGDEALKENSGIDLGEENVFDTEGQSGESSDQGSALTTDLEEQALISRISLKDRFHPGSEIDRKWRYSIGAFLVGALPQIVKVFAMRGIWGTTTFISIFLINFTVPEMFRVVAGTAGAVELQPLPIVIRIKKRFVDANNWALCYSSLLSLLQLVITFGMIPWGGAYSAISLAFALAYAITLIFTILWRLFKRTHTFLSCVEKFGELGHAAHVARKTYYKTSNFLSNLFGLNVCAYIIGPRIIPLILITTAIALVLNYNRWDPYVALLHSQCESCNVFVDFLWYTLFTTPSFVLLTTFIPFLLFTLGIRLLYRLLFMGSMSAYPRRLTGINGSMGEFLSGYYILILFFCWFETYATGIWYTVEETYKPPWTEYLG